MNRSITSLSSPNSQSHLLLPYLLLPSPLSPISLPISFLLTTHPNCSLTRTIIPNAIRSQSRVIIGGCEGSGLLQIGIRAARSQGSARPSCTRKPKATNIRRQPTSNTTDRQSRQPIPQAAQSEGNRQATQPIDNRGNQAHNQHTNQSNQQTTQTEGNPRATTELLGEPVEAHQPFDEIPPLASG